MKTKRFTVLFTLLWVALSGAALAQAPANDDFANASVLTGASGSDSGDNTGATTQGPEPSPFGDTDNDNTVWFRWQAPANGDVTFDLSGAAFDTVMSIYTGTSLATLVLVSEDDDSGDGGGGPSSAITFTATAGTTYRIQVAGLGGTTFGEEGLFPIAWALANPAGTFVFSTDFVSVNEATGMVTLQVDRLGGSTGDVTVTYTTHEVSADDPTDFTGITDTITFLDGETTMTFDIPIADDPDVEIDETFTVELISTTGGASIGTLSIEEVTIQSDDLPANDNFANAALIAGATGNVVGSDVGATSESGVEDNSVPGPVVWYKWVAPSNGAVVFSLTPAAGSQFVEILRGPGLPALVFVSEGALRGRAAVSIVAGTTYYLAVGTQLNGTQAPFTLAWETTTTGVFDLAGFAPQLPGDPVPRYVVSQGGGTATVTIRRSGSLTGTVSVVCSVAAGAYAPTATDGVDFTAVSATVTFNAGEKVKTVTVPILGSVTPDAVLNAAVTLTTPAGGAVLGNIIDAKLQIFGGAGDPANDNLANAQAIFGPSGQVFGDNANADPEPVEPPFSLDAVGNTIWYRWVAPLGGTAEFLGTIDDGFGLVDAIVDVFSSGVTGLAPVATGGVQRFTAVQGQTYLVRVDTSSANSTFGPTTLTWNTGTGGLVSFAADTVVVRETDANFTATVTVQRAGGLASGASVNIVATDDTADATDYVLLTPTVFFAAGEVSKTVDITIVGDGAPEGSESFSLALANPTGALLAVPTVATVTIDDDDDDPANDLFANAQVLAGPAGSVNGDNTGAGQETGEPNPVGNATPTVWYSWTPSATGVATFTSSGFDTVMAIYTGSAVGALTLVGENDDDALGNSVVSFLATNGITYRIQVGGYSGNFGAFTLDYTLDPAGSLISIASTQVSVAENVAGGNLVLTLTRTGSTAGTSTVDFNMFDDTAFSPGDYTATSGTITFNPTDVTQTITIPIGNDTEVEGDELFSVLVFNATGAILSPVASTSIEVTILDNDDDPAPPANDNFANAATLTGNNPIAAGFSDGATTEASEPGTPAQSVWYQWTAPGAGVAVAGIGDAAHSFNVFTGTALNNLAPVSYLTGTSFATTNGTTYFVQVNATGTNANFVLSLGFTGAGLLSIDAGGLVVNEDGGSAAITIVRANGSSGPISVRFSTAGITATSGADFTAVDQVVNFGNGITSQPVNVPIAPDALLEGPETIRLLLSDATGGALILYGPADVVALTINDADDNPANDNFANAVALSGPFGTTFGDNTGASTQTGEPNHANASGGASLWYRWTAPATGTVTFTTTGSTIATALAAYTGATVATLTPLASNAGNPSTISFAATAGASYAIAVDSSGAAQGDVTLDWQLVLPGVLGFSPVSYTAAEGTASIVLTVARGVGADGAVSVHFKAVNGTATAGQDYTATEGDLNFANGILTQTITVPLLNDTAFEIGESFTVVLSAPTNGATLGVATATVTLTSNDPFTASAVNFAALVNPGGTHANAGLLTLTESATGSFTGKLILGGKTYPLKGAFDAFGSALLTIARKGLSTIAVSIQLDDGGVTIAGHVYDSTFDSLFAGEASFYDGKARLYPQPGPFTLALKPTSATAGIPQGFGTSVMTVGANGVFTIKGGQLADGAALKATGFIAQSGQAQFYSLLYKGAGSLAGVVTFANLAATDATATLQWFKPANVPKEKFFVGGFNTTSDLVASFFTKPAPNTRIDTAFDANNGATGITLRDGNLAAPLAFSGLLDTKNKLAATAPVPLTLAGNSKTGQFTGSFTPVGGKKTAFKGVFLQKSDNALGQFFGASQSGGVTVVPD